MRKQIIDGLPMAGEKVRGFDDAYASKVAEYINGFTPQQGGLGQAAQTGALIASGYPATRKLVMDDVSNTMPGAQVLDGLMEYGVPALNAGVRYGVPAAGLIGLGNGLGSLYDLASQTPVMGNNPQ